METHTDPVCGKQVDERAADDQSVQPADPMADDLVDHTSEYLGRKYYFCSEGCKHKFDQRPEDYVVKTGRTVQESLDE